ncbi:hypothetical protein PR202_ga04790 [Eleusine coracana subsp. coracana]|uniref:non-specific serine/threonine protein kinase n=1 Tax=Eleusine coracana subsp. coracana TaxID=191504 RepID=A0AAV5BQS6_ELECO|nr:hypothetical protein PR202_ga04790 [Eleusine coracana subsp. coracana]
MREHKTAYLKLVRDAVFTEWQWQWLESEACSLSCQLASFGVAAPDLTIPEQRQVCSPRGRLRGARELLVPVVGRQCRRRLRRCCATSCRAGRRCWACACGCSWASPSGSPSLLLLALISLHLAARRGGGGRGRASPRAAGGGGAAALPRATTTIPPVSKEIQEVAVHVGSLRHYLEMGHAFLTKDATNGAQQQQQHDGDGGESVGTAHGSQRVYIEAGKGRRMVAACGADLEAGADVAVAVGPEVSHLGWGHWYTLRELEEATAAFAPEHVVGEGGYGIVYRGVFADGYQVAVKNLMNNRGQAEREFKVEVEAIGRVRHKNLVRLLGYCAEGAHRILVYEYVDNGNLEQWLHGDVGPVSPLTWDIRMNVVLGTAKGCLNFPIYVAPEYASTGMLNERSDVYSFGILIMEIISGRSPVDYARPPGEVNLVEWLKNMVSNRDYEAILDPKLPEKPSSKALKKALLVALRCVDPDSQKRPKMGHVIHMLEVDDFPYREDRRTLRPGNGSPLTLEKARTPGKPVAGSCDSSCYEGNTTTASTPSRLVQDM